MVKNPSGEKSSSSAYNSHQARVFGNSLDDLLGYSTVHSHKVNAVFGVFFYGFEDVVLVHVDYCFFVLDDFDGSLVYGHGSDRYINSLQYRLTYLV